MSLAVLVFFAVPLIRAAVDPASDPAGVEQALGTSELSAHDQGVLASISGHVLRFNAAVLPLITDYADPTVSALRWVRSSGRHIEEMRDAASGMEADILSIQDDGVRNTLLTLWDTLRQEVLAITELRRAVAHLDVKAERAALKHLQRAATQRRQQGLELLDQLRPYVDPATLQELLETAASQGS